MRVLTTAFLAKIIALTLLLFVIAVLGVALFLPRVYSSEVENGEDIIIIRAPRGGIVRSLPLTVGSKVRSDTIVAEIITTDKQPPEASIARAILYKRVENARYESQRGGLKSILLKPDLRARVPLDKEYGRFVSEQRRAFAGYQSRLKKETKDLHKARARLLVQVRGMEGEIVNLVSRQGLLESALSKAGGSGLAAELRRNRVSLSRHRKQLKDLQGKVLANAKSLLNATYQIRREEGEGMERARSELNALYARIGLPKNAFDRIGLSGNGGKQRLRRLIARRAGRVVFQRRDLKPGDVVVTGEEIAHILPNASSSLYRLRLPDYFANSEVISGYGLSLRELSCADFPQRLTLNGERHIRGDSLLLARSFLVAQDFPAPRSFSSCASVFGFSGGWKGFSMLLRLQEGLLNYNYILQGDGLFFNKLNFKNESINLINKFILFFKLNINISNKHLNSDIFTWSKIYNSIIKLIEDVNNL